MVCHRSYKDKMEIGFTHEVERISSEKVIKKLTKLSEVGPAESMSKSKKTP